MKFCRNQIKIYRSKYFRPKQFVKLSNFSGKNVELAEDFQEDGKTVVEIVTIIQTRKITQIQVVAVLLQNCSDFP